MSFVYSHPFTGLANGLNTINAAGGGAVGGWVELGRTTLGGANDTISVSSLADKRYYQILVDNIPSGSTQHQIRLGSSSTLDTGTNYAFRYSRDGAADATGTSQAVASVSEAAVDVNGFDVGYIANRSSNEKLSIFNHVGNLTAGAGTAPNRQESVWKWTNTSNALDILGLINGDAGDFASGSEVVVLGWDPDDTHTNNFWTELASVNGDGSGGFDVSFTAKKYLWIQAYLDKSASATDQIQFGSTTIDTGTNYPYRQSINGAADGTATSQPAIPFMSTSSSTNTYVNMFMINNASNEKLVIGHSIIEQGAGAGTAPRREEFVGKWVNTSNQADILRLIVSSGDYTSTSICKVWGAD